MRIVHFPVTRTFIYGILARPAYIGGFHVDDEVIPAIHEPIIDRETWEAARQLKESRKLKRPPVTADTNLLLGLLFDDLGRQMVIWSGTRDCTLDAVVRRPCAVTFPTAKPRRRKTWLTVFSLSGRRDVRNAGNTYPNLPRHRSRSNYFRRLASAYDSFTNRRNQPIARL